MCGLWFEDVTGLIEITDRSSVIRKALGHSWDEGVVTKEAAYSEEGVRTYTCLRNSAHTKTEAIPAKERKSRRSVGSARAENSRSSASAANSSWTQDGSGWHCIENGARVRDDWRFLSYNGANYWYYFDGAGVMKTGWQMIDGKWYYFEPEAGRNQGHLYRAGLTPDGFYVGEDGAWNSTP